jgi:hypothetical protein
VFVAVARQSGGSGCCPASRRFQPLDAVDHASEADLDALVHLDKALVAAGLPGGDEFAGAGELVAVLIQELAEPRRVLWRL